MSKIRSPSAGDPARYEKAAADARRAADQRSLGYREQAMKMYPWVCGRCSREFTHANRHELTVHHRNHDHDFNPADGSNWELLCLYCHDNEHSRLIEAAAGGQRGQGVAGNGHGSSGSGLAAVATGNPFSDLKALLKR